MYSYKTCNLTSYPLYLRHKYGQFLKLAWHFLEIHAPTQMKPASRAKEGSSRPRPSVSKFAKSERRFPPQNIASIAAAVAPSLA